MAMKFRVARKTFVLLLLILSGPDPLCFSAQSRKSQTLDPRANLYCSAQSGRYGVALAVGDALRAVLYFTPALLTLFMVVLRP